jgi:hypothetical protein
VLHVPHSAVSGIGAGTTPVRPEPALLVLQAAGSPKAAANETAGGVEAAGAVAAPKTGTDRRRRPRTITADLSFIFPPHQVRDIFRTRPRRTPGQEQRKQLPLEMRYP